MTLSEVIRAVDEMKPNAFSNTTKTLWINEVEGLVQTEVMLLALDECISYDYSTHANFEMLVKAPHDKLYRAYLCAMVDFSNGEYNKYQNTMQLFNAYFGEYMRWYASRISPADGDATEHGYYLSAFGLAKVHGFEGTEEEWLASLHGERGEQGMQGERGERGIQGPVGPQGERGPKGDTGDEGPSGDKGDTGPAGPKGDKGDAGQDGRDGVSPTVAVSKVGKVTTISITDALGTKVATIHDGADGTGSAGGGEDGVGIASIVQTQKSSLDDGINIVSITLTDGSVYNFEVQNGSRGSEGPKGSTGPAGPKGDTGDTGPAGNDGKSAYAYAKEHGFSGSESEFGERMAADLSRVRNITFSQSEPTNVSGIALGEIVAVYE